MYYKERRGEEKKLNNVSRQLRPCAGANTHRLPRTVGVSHGDTIAERDRATIAIGNGDSTTIANIRWGG